MKNNPEKKAKEAMQKKTGIVLLILIALFLVYFLFFTPVSPLGGNLRAGASANPVPAVGLWGKIGFFEAPADNNLTYFLMFMFFGTAIFRILRTAIFPKKQQNQRLTGGLRRKKLL